MTIRIHMPASTSTTKSELRTEFEHYRASLSDAAYAERSAAIRAQARALPELDAARTVHIYWPMTDEREVDTRPLIERLHRQGRCVVLPVVTRFDGTPEMTHRRYTGPACLATNRWGLREPQDTPEVSPASLDAVLVPALGAGRNGHRIGHGFGYYDAFLPRVAAPTLTLVYAACLVDAVPADPHDIPVSMIATEHEIIRPDACYPPPC